MLITQVYLNFESVSIYAYKPLTRLALLSDVDRRLKKDVSKIKQDVQCQQERQRDFMVSNSYSCLPFDLNNLKSTISCISLAY